MPPAQYPPQPGYPGYGQPPAQMPQQQSMTGERCFTLDLSQFYINFHSFQVHQQDRLHPSSRQHPLLLQQQQVDQLSTTISRVHNRKRHRPIHKHKRRQSQHKQPLMDQAVHLIRHQFLLQVHRRRHHLNRKDISLLHRTFRLQVLMVSLNNLLNFSKRLTIFQFFRKSLSTIARPALSAAQLSPSTLSTAARASTSCICSSATLSKLPVSETVSLRPFVSFELFPEKLPPLFFHSGPPPGQQPYGQYGQYPPQ